MTKTFLCLADIDLDTIIPLQSLWGDIIFPESIVILIGDPKIGKSTVLYHLLGTLSNGLSWGGIFPQQPLRTLYMELENPRNIIIQRLANLKAIYPQTPDSNFVVQIYDWVTQTDPFKFIEESIAQFQPQVIVVDPLHYPGTKLKEENNPDNMIEALRPLIVIARKHKLCLIVPHHFRKLPPGVTQDAMKYAARGSGALPGTVDAQISLTESGSNLLFRHDFSRYVGGSRCKQWLIEPDYDDTQMPKTVVLATRLEALQPKDALRLADILPLLPLTRDNLVKELIFKDICSRRTAYRWIASLVENGTLNITWEGIVSLK